MKFHILIAKFEENDSSIPDLTTFQLLDSLSYFYANEIINHEIVCLKLLKYDLCQYSAFHFLKFFCAQGIIFENEINDNDNYKYFMSNFNKENNKLIVKTTYERKKLNSLGGVESNSKEITYTSPRDKITDKTIQCSFEALATIIDGNSLIFLNDRYKIFRIQSLSHCAYICFPW